MTGRYQLSDDPDRFPRPFGSYLLLSPLGKGGMGEVFLAKRRTSHGSEVCVVKMLRADLVKDREYVMRFIDEANVVVRLQHKNICHVFDVGKTPKGQIFLAMEYLSGVDAKTLCDRATERGIGVDPAAAVQVGIDVLEALHHAHTRTDPKSGESLELIHRDVSPHNVVIGYDGISKLIDFGLASSTMKIEQTAPNVVMGKMAYMGPEQARGDPIDATADQFAAVMVMYELLAGERFYEGLTANEIWNTVGRGGFRPRKFKTIDRPLRSILDKAMHKNAAKRYATCKDLRDALATHQEKTFPVSGAESVRSAVSDLMSDELDAEWERMAGFAEVSLSGFTGELKAHAPENTIARAMPGSGPVRDKLPAPRAASPADPTAILHASSVSGSGKAAAARGHGQSGAESTELVSRRHRASKEGSSATTVVRDRSVPSREATEVVPRSTSGGVPVQTDAGVVIVHPSQAHAARPGPNKVLVAAVGGMLTLLLLLLGALMMTLLTGDKPEEVAQDGRSGDTQPDDVQPGGTPPGDGSVTGIKRTDPLPDGDGDDPGSGAPDDASGAEQAAGPGSSDTDDDDDKAERRRRSRRGQKTTTAQRREREREAKEREAADDRKRQAEQAAAAAADAQKAERAQAQARAAERDSNKERIARGKARLAKAGYSSEGEYPSKARKALDAAEADMNDTSAAKRFEKVARRTPKKQVSPPPSRADGKFDYKGRLRTLVKKCIASGQPCAKKASQDLSNVKAIDKRSSAARRKLQRDIIQCEKSCGLR